MQKAHFVTVIVTNFMLATNHTLNHMFHKMTTRIKTLTGISYIDSTCVCVSSFILQYGQHIYAHAKKDRQLETMF